jgi:hypothetical protein
MGDSQFARAWDHPSYVLTGHWLLSDSQISVLSQGDAKRRDIAQEAAVCRLVMRLRGEDSLLLLPRTAGADTEGFSFAVFEPAGDDTGGEPEGGSNPDSLYEPLWIGIFRSLRSCDSAEAIVRNLLLPTEVCAGEVPDSETVP